MQESDVQIYNYFLIPNKKGAKLIAPLLYLRQIKKKYMLTISSRSNITKFSIKNKKGRKIYPRLSCT